MCQRPTGKENQNSPKTITIRITKKSFADVFDVYLDYFLGRTQEQRPADRVREDEAIYTPLLAEILRELNEKS